MKKSLSIILALVMVFMTFTFTACRNDPEFKEVKGNGKPDTSSETEEETTTIVNTDLGLIQDEKTLVFAISADFPPYAYIEENEYLGIDIELMQAFSSSIGVELQFKNVDFDSVVDLVSTGNADCAGSGLTITEDRMQYIDFSDVYLADKAVILLPADEPDDAYTASDFKLAVANGQYIYYLDTENLNYTQFITLDDAVMAMQNSGCDGCIVYEEFAKEFIKDNPDYKIAATYSEDSYAMAFPKGSPLIPLFNQFIKDYKASGEFDKLLQKYDFM